MFIDGNAISELPLQADEKGRLAFHPSLVEREGKELEIKVIFWNAQYPKTMHSEVPAFTWLKGKKVVRLRAYNLYEMTPRAIPNENNEPATYKRPYHVIRRGDTWESIEQEAGVNRYALLWENGLDEATPLETLVGKKIYFPRGVRKGNAKLQMQTKTPKPMEKKKERNVLQVRSENNGKPVDVVMPHQKYECFCHRDFTVDEFKSIVKGLRRGVLKHTKLWIPAFSSGASPSDKTYEATVEELNRVMDKYEINTCLRKIHFLAQAYHETHFFQSMQEYTSVYTTKYDPYRGRGLIHLTHKKNYKKFSEDMNDNAIVLTPNIVATEITYAFESGGWFWKKGGILSNNKSGIWKYPNAAPKSIHERIKVENANCNKSIVTYGSSKETFGVLDLNILADNDWGNTISWLINGGANGFDERIKYRQFLKDIMKYETCKNKK